MESLVKSGQAELTFVNAAVQLLPARLGLNTSCTDLMNVGIRRHVLVVRSYS